MSTPREWYLNFGTTLGCEVRTQKQFDDDRGLACSDYQEAAIPVIEKTPEVVRKLECFDELVRHLEFLMDIDPASGEVLTLEKYQEIEDLIKKAKGE
jgi:hypothetical protein